jgi:hypothetical protein
MQAFSANVNNAQSLNSDLSHLKCVLLIAMVFDSFKPNIDLVFSFLVCSTGTRRRLVTGVRRAAVWNAAREAYLKHSDHDVHLFG